MELQEWETEGSKKQLVGSTVKKSRLRPRDGKCSGEERTSATRREVVVQRRWSNELGREVRDAKQRSAVWIKKWEMCFKVWLIKIRDFLFLKININIKWLKSIYFIDTIYIIIRIILSFHVHGEPTGWGVWSPSPSLNLLQGEFDPYPYIHREKILEFRAPNRQSLQGSPIMGRNWHPYCLLTHVQLSQV